MPRSKCRIGAVLMALLVAALTGSMPADGATLYVTMSGTGQGSVNSSPTGIACPGDCSGTFTSFTLYPNPDTASCFSGWGGACAGMETCALTLDGDRTVNACFELKSDQQRVSGSNYGAIQTAYNTIASGGRLLVVARDQPGDLTLDKAISFTLAGGYDDNFTSNADNRTKLQGKVTVREGSLAIQRMSLAPSATQELPPAAPTGVTATPGDGQAAVTWDEVPGATSYNVYYSISPGVSRSSGTRVAGATRGDAITGLTNGVTYYFVVTAADLGGESVESSQVIITPFNAAAPGAPDAVSASAGSTQVEVSWNDVAGVAYYSVYWSIAPGVTTTTGTKVSPIAASSYQHTGLTNGTSYYYIVTATIGATESAASAVASAKPAAAAANSRLLKMTVYAVKKSSTTKAYTIYEYDDATGRVQNEDNYADVAGTGIFTGSIAYEYDDNGNMTRKSNYDVNGNLFSYITTTYNSAENALMIIYYTGYGTYFFPAEYTLNEYDSATGTLLLKSTTYNGMSHLLLGYTAYEYNASGDVTRQTNYPAGVFNGYSTTEYNAARDIIRESEYDVNSDLSEYTTIVYNTAGKMSKKTTYNGFTDLMTKFTTCEYNTVGKLVRSSSYDFANNLTGYSTIAYNTEGKKTIISVYDDTGVVTARTTYEYGY